MVAIRVIIDDTQWKSVAANLKAAGQNLRPMMTVAGGILENSTRSRFDTGRGPGGIPWKPSRRAALQGGKTLQDRGLLRGSITSNVGDNFVITGVDARSVSAKYARTHQFGAIIRPRTARKLAFRGADGGFVVVDQVTIPARPFVGIDDDDVRDLREAFVDYLERAATNGGN